jgi:hypothetical protein
MKKWTIEEVAARIDHAALCVHRDMAAGSY